MALSELSSISLHVGKDEFLADLRSRIITDAQKLIVLVDAPTSKPKVVVDLMGIAKDLISQLKHSSWCVVVPVGRRTDLLHTVMTNAAINMKDHSCFTVLQTAGNTQGARSRPSFSVYVRGKGCKQDDVPVSLEVNSCRAKPFECLRLRCGGGCSFQSAQDPLLDDENPAAEIEVDDREDGQEDFMEILEDEDDPMDGSAAKKQQGRASGKKRDLWPFARPVAHYEGL